jgi:folate-dependent phosphoribosylglycinamide formyltransferase PurN
MLKKGQVITQDDINAKLFENLEKLEQRMDKFEAKIMMQMNWQLAIFTVIMVGVLAKVITA